MSDNIRKLYLRDYILNGIIISKGKAAGRLFQMHELQRAHFAFRRALDARPRSRITRRPSVIEGKKLALEAGQPRDFITVLIQPVTIHICTEWQASTQKAVNEERSPKSFVTRYGQSHGHVAGVMSFEP